MGVATSPKQWGEQTQRPGNVSIDFVLWVQAFLQPSTADGTKTVFDVTIGKLGLVFLTHTHVSSQEGQGDRGGFFFLLLPLRTNVEMHFPTSKSREAGHTTRS